jgi:uncharacterized protein
MDMPVHLIKGFHSQQGRVAIMRGPMVFCLNPSLNKVVEGKNLKDVIIDPSTFSVSKVANCPERESLFCTVTASFCDNLNGDDSFDLKLTPFPDQDGRAIYYLTKDMSCACEDKLLGKFRVVHD